MLFRSSLASESRNIRFASATGLIYYKERKALKTISQILSLEPSKGNDPSNLDENKIYGLKLNVINGLKKTGWKELAIIVEKYMKNEKNLKLVSISREVLGGLE
mgnify:CR=1 FL=1